MSLDHFPKSCNYLFLAFGFITLFFICFIPEPQLASFVSVLTLCNTLERTTCHLSNGVNWFCSRSFLRSLLAKFTHLILQFKEVVCFSTISLANRAHFPAILSDMTLAPPLFLVCLGFGCGRFSSLFFNLFTKISHFDSFFFDCYFSAFFNMPCMRSAHFSNGVLYCLNLVLSRSYSHLVFF